MSTTRDAFQPIVGEVSEITFKRQVGDLPTQVARYEATEFIFRNDDSPGFIGALRLTMRVAFSSHGSGATREPLSVGRSFYFTLLALDADALAKGLLRTYEAEMSLLRNLASLIIQETYRMSVVFGRVALGSVARTRNTTVPELGSIGGNPPAIGDVSIEI